MGLSLPTVSSLDMTAFDCLRVTRGLDEEKTTVYSSVLDVSLALRGKFLSKVGGMLILDILDDRIPAVTRSESSCWQ